MRIVVGVLIGGLSGYINTRADQHAMLKTSKSS